MSRSTQNTVNTVQPYLQHPTFPGPLAQNNFRIVMSDIALGDDNLPDVNIDELFDDMTYEESIIVSTKNAVGLNVEVYKKETHVPIAPGCIFQSWNCKDN